jgi:hypothetical protein
MVKSRQPAVTTTELTVEGGLKVSFAEEETEVVVVELFAWLEPDPLRAEATALMGIVLVAFTA